MPSDQSMPCLRCGSEMSFQGTKKFHEGTRQWAFWLGDFGELFVNRQHFDVYACSNCGKVELFLDGLGEHLRPH